jgi:hypothetical protein
MEKSLVNEDGNNSFYSKAFYEAIVHAFERYLSAIDTLCLHVHDDLKHYPLWVDNGSETFIGDRDRLIYALKHISPKLGLEPQETFSCPGAVGATRQTLKLIDQLNKTKDQFKAQVQNYKHVFKSNPTKPARQILAQAGHGGVKLLQVYRHIYYIDFHPRRIAWTKGKGGSYQVINKSQAQALVLKAGQGEHIDIQLAKLSLLPADQKLMIYRSLRSLWGVNVSTFKDKSNHSVNLRIREISLPLFYLHNNKLGYPIVTFSKKTDRKVKARNDKTLEEIPFLKSIHAYRYKRSS